MSVFISRQLHVPVLGKLASDYAVGESVFLNVGGVSREFLVVHQGIPSDMYDSSCDGTWLLQKHVFEQRQWHSSDVNDYKNSDIHAYLKNTFFGLFDTNFQSAIKQVKIPYVNGQGDTGSVESGSNGLSTKVFLLSGYEVGWTYNPNGVYLQYLPIDGACLDYFIGTFDTDAKRIAYFEGIPDEYGEGNCWSLRSPYTKSKYSPWRVAEDGYHESYNCVGVRGVRPAVILPNNALFDPDTNTFKGVAT